MSDAATSGRQGWIRFPDPDEDFTADPVELFFDLAFVFAFSQIVGRLVHEPDVEGVLRSGMLFLLLWLPWTQFTWSINAVSGRARTVQAIVLVATTASVPMAASVSTAFGAGGPSFAIPLGVILVMGLAVLLLGYPTGSDEFTSAVVYAIPNAVAVVFVVIGGFLDETPRTVLWGVALLSVVLGTVRAGRGRWVIRSGHFAERHGLIIIVALGEVIVAVAIPVLTALEETEGLPGDTISALVAAGVFACLLWWAYFDRPQQLFEHRLGALGPAERGRFARDLYTYLHMPIVAGVILSAAALEEITLHPTDELPFEFRMMLLAGLALFLGGIDVGVLRAFHVIPPERAAGAVVIALVLLAGDSLTGLALLIIVDVVFAAVLLLEARRLEKPSMTVDDPS